MNFGGIAIGNSVLFGQVGNLLGALFLSLIGMGLLYTQLYWRRNALTVEAEVIGVRQAGLNVHTVYRFALPSGEIHQATSAQGSTNLHGRDTGGRVLIQVMPDRPDEVRESGSATIWALTIGSLAAGVWLTWLALTSWPVALLMWIVFAGVAYYLGSHVARLLKSRKDLVALGRIQGEAKWSSWPVQPVEELVASPRVRVVSSKQRRSGGIFCVVGLAIIGFAYIPAQRLLALRAGAHATGVVTQLVSNNANNNDPNIFPDVQFTGANGAVVRFLDRTGSNPAPYKVGDHVAVIYQPENPSSTAMIDRGGRNWLPVGMMLLFGATFAALGLFSLRRTREQRAG